VTIEYVLDGCDR